MGTRTILVVDGNEDCRESLAQLLRHSGHTVVTADGCQAVMRLRPFAVDVALIDSRLPGGCARAAVQLSRGAATQVFVLATSTAPPDGGRPQPVAVLRKPATADELECVLGHVARSGPQDGQRLKPVNTPVARSGLPCADAFASPAAAGSAGGSAKLPGWNNSGASSSELPTSWS